MQSHHSLGLGVGTDRKYNDQRVHSKPGRKEAIENKDVRPGSHRRDLISSRLVLQALPCVCPRRTAIRLLDLTAAGTKLQPS